MALVTLEVPLLSCLLAFVSLLAPLVSVFPELSSAVAPLEGVTRFIVAGGETSGVVTQSLGIKGFHIGPTISPGVPWVNALDKPVSLALKSGNFGDEAFFSRAQREFLS